MSIWFQFVIILTKFINFIVQKTGKGSGTALPGLIAERIAPGVLSYLCSQIDSKIVITGTNGKTTTQTLLGSILSHSNHNFVANKSGANLKRGIISTLIKNSDIFGKLRLETGIFELEEATMPQVIEDLKPDTVIVTNLFRDQLDAYGEIDRTQKFIRSAVEKVPSATLILNGDDPRVQKIANGLPNKVIYYGLDQTTISDFNYEGQVDKLDQLSNVQRATNISINQDLSSEFTFKKIDYALKAPGKFHIYNSLAAILAAEEMGIDERYILKGINLSDPAFGRGEIIEKEGVTYRTLLVKNPAGMTLTLKLLEKVPNSNIIFILNDEIADGRDVSWIWDAQFEILNKIKPRLIICSGIRAEDLLLRIKYTFNSLAKTGHDTYFNRELNCKVLLIKDTNELHKRLRNEAKYFYVLPTYTALLKFRKLLTGRSLNE